MKPNFPLFPLTGGVDLKTEDAKIVLITADGEQRSILDRLTATQKAELLAWSKNAPRCSGGTIDMMAWPGWAQVVADLAPPTKGKGGPQCSR